MTATESLCLLATLMLLPTSETLAEEPAVGSFRYTVEIFGVGPDRIGKSELVFHEGTFYQFFSGATDEVVVIEPPPKARITLIDLARKIQCQVVAVELDANVDRLRRSLMAKIDRLEESEERSDRLKAAMARDLASSRFPVDFDAETRTLTLRNDSVTVEATGESDSDPRRLSLVGDVLAMLRKFSSMREPDDLPPFAMLETLRGLTIDRRLRPKEISQSVRLAGPPRKVRWSYTLVPALTDREREAIRRVDGLRASASLVPFRTYERSNGPD